MRKTDFSVAFNRRYLVCVILAFLIATYISLNIENIHLIPLKPFLVYSGGFICVLVILSGSLCFVFRKNREVTALIIAAVVAVLFFIIGFSRVYFVSREQNDKYDIITTHPQIRGVITSEPQVSSTGKSLMFLFDVHIAEDGENTEVFEKSCVVRLCIPKDNDMIREPKIGDTISGKIAYELSSKPAFEGAFEYNRYLLQNGVIYNGYMNNPEISVPLPKRTGILNGLSRVGLKVRGLILESTDKYPYGKDEKALLKGILVGDTNEFSDDLTEDLKGSGLSHITSVSGMHTSYLFIAIALLLGLLRFPRRGIALITIPIMVMFAAVAQFTPSVNRAVVMTIFMLVATSIRRSNDSITALACAAFLLVAKNPYCLENVGFLLSFSATLGILVFYKPLMYLHNVKKTQIQYKGTKKMLYSLLTKLKKFAKNSVCLTLSATIGLGYFMARFFGVIQWGSVISNIFVFPLTAVAFIGGYFNVAVDMIAPRLAGILARYIVNPALWSIVRIAEQFSRKGFAINVPCPSAAFFPVYIIICIGFYILLQKDEKENKI